GPDIQRLTGLAVWWALFYKHSTPDGVGCWSASFYKHMTPDGVMALSQAKLCSAATRRRFSFHTKADSQLPHSKDHPFLVLQPTITLFYSVLLWYCCGA